jgi:hypothetical protein
MDQEERLKALRERAAARYGRGLALVRTVPVSVEAKGEEVQRYDVHVFEPEGAGASPRIFAWFQRVEGEPRRRAVIVPMRQGVSNPEDAVRWALARRVRGDAEDGVTDLEEDPGSE